jgi:transposase
MTPYNIEIFSLALGLESPWFIEDIKFVSVNNNPFKELYININFHKGHQFPLEDGSSVTAYDTLPKRWRHSNFFQHKCYLHCRVPRIKNPDGKVRMISVPWARPGSGLTLLFEAFSMILVESEMPINKAAECVQETAPLIMRVVNHWVEEAFEDVDLSEVRSIGIDETSSKKGHNYVTVVADIAERRS